MTKPVTKSKTLAEVYAYIADENFNAYDFGRYIENLLSQGVNISTEKIDGRTLLGYAARKLNSDAVKALLEQDADPTITTRDNKTGEWTPIYWALYSGDAIEPPLDPTVRIKIIDEILSNTTYEKVSIQARPLISQVPNPSMVMQLLAHGAGLPHSIESKNIEQALNTLSSKIKKPAECLALQDLHPSTIDALSTNLEFIQFQAIKALQSGATPVMIGGEYTQFTHNALDAIAEKLGDPTNVKSIETFLEISLHPNAKSYIELTGVDFAKLLDNAVDKILHDALDPIRRGSDVFTDNACEAIEKVQARLEADQSLLLYSKIHPNSFLYMDKEKTDEIKLAAIDMLKSGTEPRDGENELTSHAQELIDYIALESKKDVAQWLAIKGLDLETINLIDASLKTIDSSIDMLNAEIITRLKNGEDLGIVSEDSDFVTILTPNTQKVIGDLCKELEGNPSLLFHVNLSDPIQDLLSKTHKGGMDDLVTKAMNALIAKKDVIYEGDFAQYTDTLYNLLTSDPKQLLYFKDANITKIHSDLGEEKFLNLKKLAITAIKQGAHSKSGDHLPTLFATSLFNEIIDSIRLIDSTRYDRDFTKEGIGTLKEFGASSPEALEYINRLDQHLFPKEATSLFDSILGYVFGAAASATNAHKPDATCETDKSVPDTPLDTEAGSALLTGDAAASNDA